MVPDAPNSYDTVAKWQEDRPAYDVKNLRGFLAKHAMSVAGKAQFKPENRSEFDEGYVRPPPPPP